MLPLPAPVIISPATPTPGRGHRRAEQPACSIITLRVTDDERQMIFALADERGQTVSSLVREALAVAHPGLPAMHIKVTWKVREKIVREADREAVPVHPGAAVAAAARQAAGRLVQRLGAGPLAPSELAEIRRAVADLRTLASQVGRIP